MKIYDGFLFFNELDLLEIRLNVLNSVVDKFILVESSVTHQGEPKPFIFEENKNRYSKFLNKITHIKITNTPDDFSNLSQGTDKFFNEIYDYISKTTLFDVYNKNHLGYGRDFFQKECIKLGTTECKDDDIIIHSDVDEIPNPEILNRLNEFFEPEKFYTFNQTHYCYYLNMICYSHIDNSRGNYLSEIDSNWKGSRMGSYKKIKNYSFNELRAQDNINIMEGGWHFSFMGGIDKVKTKIKSYSHQEQNNSSILNSIEKYINSNADIIHEGKLIKTKIDETFPEYIINNINKYEHMIKE